MNKQIIDKLKKWNPEIKLDGQVYYSEYDDNIPFWKINHYDKDLINKIIKAYNYKYTIDEYTEESSLLFKYNVTQIVIDEDIDLINYTIVLNVCDIAKYENWRSELYGVSSASMSLIENINFHDILIGNTKYKYVNCIECHGSKCRQGIYDEVWCTDCYGELNCKNLHYFLKNKINFNDVPENSIFYTECTKIKIDFKNEDHLKNLQYFKSYIKEINNRITEIEKKINGKTQLLSDHELINDFLKTNSNKELSDALVRLIPTIDMNGLYLERNTLLTKIKNLNNEMNFIIQCDGEMPKKLLELLNITITI